MLASPPGYGEESVSAFHGRTFFLIRHCCVHEAEIAQRMPPLPLHGYNHSQAWPHWTVSFQVTLRALELDMLEKRDLVVAFLLGAFEIGRAHV